MTLVTYTVVYRLAGQTRQHRLRVETTGKPNKKQAVGWVSRKRSLAQDAVEIIEIKEGK